MKKIALMGLMALLIIGSGVHCDSDSGREGTPDTNNPCGACGSDSGTGGDTGRPIDVGADGGEQDMGDGDEDGGQPSDTGFDGGTDASTDSATDTGGEDIGQDAGADADENDAELDATTDTGSMDAGQTDGGSTADVDLDSSIDDGGGDSGPDADSDAGFSCSDAQCPCGSYCEKMIGPIPQCVQGCKIVGDCCVGKDCVNGSCVAVSCQGDSDCTGSLKHCNTNTCVECMSDGHCITGDFCDLLTHTCKVDTKKCQPPCDPSTQYCDSSVSPSACKARNPKLCQGCSNLTDCNGTPDNLSCGLMSKKCTKQCTSDADCQGFPCASPFCNCP